VNILVAGLTGQLGAGIVESGHPGMTLIPLVRVVGRLDAGARVERRFPDRGDLAERAVAGDVCAPRWGLDDTRLDRLADQVDAVLNLAGETNWALPRRQLYATNVLGARHGLELALELRRRGGRCATYCYASSVHVAGGAIGRVPETRLDPAADRTTYEQSKWIAEEALSDRAPRDEGLKVAIARIGGLVGNSVTGKTSTRNSLYRLADLWDKLPAHVLAGVPDGRVDMLPRDMAGEFLVRAVLGLRDASPAEPHIFHVCAGDGAPTIRSLVGAVRSLDATGGLGPLRLAPVPHGAVRWLSQNLDRASWFSPTWRNALIGHRYVSLPRVFERDRALDLAGAPLPDPPVELLARLAFEPEPAVASPVPADRPLARFSR
jgi:nucleoside-diphosphate-sugar epimerase